MKEAKRIQENAWIDPRCYGGSQLSRKIKFTLTFRVNQRIFMGTLGLLLYTTAAEWPLVKYKKGYRTCSSSFTFSKRPIRGPMNIAPTRAAIPPTA